MKFRTLKFLSMLFGLFSLCAGVVGCGDDSGNNSSTTPAGSDSSNAMTNPATSQGTSNDSNQANSSTSKPKKKVGKASVKMNAEATAKVEKDNMGYYTSTEVQPGYNGGQPALESYINNNIEYPQQAIDNDAEGTVNVHFLVDENGKISNVTATGNKIGYGLEEEAVRVVSKMPKWTPGHVKGKVVKTWRTLPITYKLEES